MSHMNFLRKLPILRCDVPYGMDGPGRPEPGPGQEHEQATNNSVQLFEFVTPPEESFEAYSRRAHVSSKASIEVVAVVTVGRSFTLPVIQCPRVYAIKRIRIPKTNPSFILRMSIWMSIVP
mmetsp:Transcript_9162/g.10682  ORF Transcript_9162/g.10682 Transcript_9162/m.10682 type:complete len:121 (+) Transcript_9162:1292-1654(+)